MAADRSPTALGELLVTNGLRVTGPRLRVLAALGHAGKAQSHAELAALLELDPPPHLDRATIYRNLITLADAGIITRVRWADGTWRFEFPANDAVHHDDHPHFVCTDCGTVSCLQTGDVHLTGETAHYAVSQVQLHGRCGGCLAPPQG